MTRTRRPPVETASPLSLTGSASRLWHWLRPAGHAWPAAVLRVTAFTLLIILVWALIIAYYAALTASVAGIWLLFWYRFGRRMRLRNAAHHAEIIAAIERTAARP